MVPDWEELPPQPVVSRAVAFGNPGPVPVGRVGVQVCADVVAVDAEVAFYRTFDQLDLYANRSTRSSRPATACELNERLWALPSMQSAALRRW